MDLIADIGATNSRCALIVDDGQIAHSGQFPNADFPSLAALLGHFVASATNQPAPRRAALAVAAPVTGGEVVMTNIGWRFSPPQLAESLELDEIRVLNDFEALGHALPRLDSADYCRIGDGAAAAGANMAVIGPGSGLGVAATAAAGDRWTVIAGEGGHVSLPAMNATEVAIIAEHGDASGHCSAERLLSGPGLVRIHATLARLDGRRAEAIEPAEVTARAARGDALASRSLAVFFAMLGTVAGNLALTVGARGGVFIAGGIVPRVVASFSQSEFRERFVAKGRYREYLAQIPTAVLTVPQPAFIGLRAVLARR
jgi:glucokinase